MESDDASVQWFEFLLSPNLLEKHLNSCNPDPSALNLIIQFIHNGMKRTENYASEGENADPATQEILDKKKRLLTVLPLKVAAYLNWDLDAFQQNLPLHIQDSLLVALLHEILEEHCNPLTHGILDTATLLPHQLFSVSLYHRYALSALVKAKLPSKPIKISNVQIPGQQDPLQESGEVHDGIIAALEIGAENSTRILEQLLTAGEVRAPVANYFSLTSQSASASYSNLDKNKLVPDEQFKYQIHFELGNYHFLQDKFTEALHHFSEAIKLMPEISSNPEFCHIQEEKLQGFYSCCSAICGRTTPVVKRALYDRFTHSLSNEYVGLLDILVEDNISCEIPLYQRQCLQLDMIGKPDKIPADLLFHVQTVNAIGDVLNGRIWDNSYLFALLRAGKVGSQYLVQLLASKLSQYTPVHRCRVKTFVEMLAMNSGVREILVKTLMACAPLASLFSHEEIVSLLPGSEEKKAKDSAKIFDCSYAADYNDTNDVTWDLVHSYDTNVLQKAFDAYLVAQLPRSGMVKKEQVLELNSKWKGLIPIPVRNALNKVMQEPSLGFILMLIAKSQELAMTKSFILSIELLHEVSTMISQKIKDSARPCKMISWMILSIKIQKQIHELPCVDENEMRSLIEESQQSIACWNSTRDSLVPWTSIIDWCIILLLNTQDWVSFSNNLVPSKSFPIMYVLKPLAATAQALNEKHPNRKPWIDLFEAICDIIGGQSQHKRNSSGQMIQRYGDAMSQASLLELIECVKEPFCLSILVSLFGHLFNILTNDQSSSLHIDHRESWPNSLNVNLKESVVLEILDLVINHATKLYPFASHPILPMCSSWFLTKGDLAYNKKDSHKTIKNYLTAIFMATDYLQNDTNNPDQNLMPNIVIERMIKSCKNLNYFTQAAILCQFTDNIDYNTAIGCLQERNAIDAMDAYYDCLYDVTLMEFIINLHQKKGEIQRRDCVMKIIGYLELNSNNNEEIQREAAKVRKHRFLRAMAKQYL